MAQLIGNLSAWLKALGKSLPLHDKGGKPQSPSNQNWHKRNDEHDQRKPQCEASRYECEQKRSHQEGNYDEAQSRGRAIDEKSLKECWVQERPGEQAPKVAASEELDELSISLGTGVHLASSLMVSGLSGWLVIDMAAPQAGFPWLGTYVLIMMLALCEYAIWRSGGKEPYHIGGFTCAIIGLVREASSGRFALAALAVLFGTIPEGGVVWSEYVPTVCAFLSGILCGANDFVRCASLHLRSQRT